MTDKSHQRAVFKGIVASWALSALFIWAGYQLVIRLEPLSDWSITKSLGFTLICGGWTLLVGIGWAARTRHFSSNIDGSKPVNGSPLDITLRYITNTVEQLLLFAIACFGFVAAFPTLAVHLLPVMGIWFLIARLLFWIGYRRNPVKRAIGFAGTFHPTIVLLAVATYKLVMG